ncbi:MAG: hypothetical protein ABIK43_03645 [candidate division WOR-3 bacterium]
MLTVLCIGQPLQNRILIAKSYDGVDWQRTGLVFCDSGDVPDAVRGSDNRVYVYYQGLWDPLHDGIMVAISSNGIADWERYQVSIPGTHGWPGKPCDPDVVVLRDTFRLYFTGDPDNDRLPETYSAVSLDGRNFDLESGVRFEVPGSAVLDPSLLWAGETLQYFAGGAPLGRNWHAHSVDGLNFVREPDVAIDSLMFSNGVALDSGFRFYGFRNLPPGGIKSVFSDDGEIWVVEPGWRLQLDSLHPLESRYVKDAAVVHVDSVWLMYYVTRKREMGIAAPDTCILQGAVSVMVMKNDQIWTPSSGWLTDAAGRRCLYLVPGCNSIRNIPTGIYFLLSKQPGRTMLG